MSKKKPIAKRKPVYVLQVEQPGCAPYSIHRFPSEWSAATWVSQQTGISLPILPTATAVEDFWLNVEKQQDGQEVEYWILRVRVHR